VDAVQLDGRININGVIRDGGTAFKAALEGYAFQINPNTDPAIASQLLTDAQINSLIKQMTNRLNGASPTGSTSGPFTERGELSELPVFNSGTDLTGQDMATLDDRGREELFRRIVELITTRGNIFTVYVVGQSLIPQAAGTPPIVTATSQTRVTFRLDPVWNTPPPTDPSWDPTSGLSVRLAKPNRYAAKILYVGD
jgi:hypothetical protein